MCLLARDRWTWTYSLCCQHQCLPDKCKLHSALNLSHTQAWLGIFCGKTPVHCCIALSPLLHSNLLKDKDNVTLSREGYLDSDTESLFMQFENHKNDHPFKHMTGPQLI